MSEELKPEVQTELPDINALQEGLIAESAAPNEAMQEEAQIEMSPEEAKAREQGWRPKEEYQGPEDEWVDAHTYLGRGTFLKQIKNLKSELQEQRKTMDMFAEHTKHMEKLMYDKAKRELEAEQKAARMRGDFDTFERVSKEIQDLKPISEQPKDPSQNPELQRFLKENTWYTAPQTEEDFELKGIAEAADTYYTKTHPNATIEEVVAYVEQKVNNRRKSYMTNSNREVQVPNALSPSKTTATKPASSKLPHPEWNKLSDFQKTVVKQMTDPKFGVKGYKENAAEGINRYIEELKQLGAI